MAAPLSLKDYLKRYESAGEDDKKKKKKKKKKEKVKPSSMGGILVVDEDPVWQKPVQIGQEESDSADEEKPQIDEDIEVKRMKRLEAIRAQKPYHAISEDGSGWVSISNSSKPTKATESSHDLSPPRQMRSRFDTPSPRTRDASQSTELSPPQRRQRRADTPPEAEIALPVNQATDISLSRRLPPADISPPRRTREPSIPSPDLSPPRRGGKHLPNDLSPRPVSTRTHNPSGLSPPRRRRRSLSIDGSPPRQNRHIFSDDTGPAASPAGDLSPPRRGSKHLSNDLSPPHQTHRQSPKAIRGHSSSPADLSPPRKSRKVPVEEPRRGGLLSAKELREENDRTRKEALSRFASMDPSLSGKSAEPVYRDAKGKAISKEELLKPKEDEKPKEKKLEWGKGLAQKRQAEAIARELEIEKDKPFARTEDDPDLDKMLKERVRWGDPMAHLVKRKNSETTLEDLGENEAMKESGFIIPQTIPAHSWLKRGVDCPPNRYGIKPGRHWDGVDRSSGFEKDMFKRQSEKRATEREAYLWSVSDM